MGAWLGFRFPWWVSNDNRSTKERIMSRNRSHRGFRPGIEILEDRCVPAVISSLAKAALPAVQNEAPAAVLIGLLKPSSPAVNAVTPAGWTQGGPQPEPPTKLFVGKVYLPEKAGVLIGLLKPAPAGYTNPCFVAEAK
jgi:hypothetical protein